MTPTLRPPTMYRPALWIRVLEGIKYGGGIGQWSWMIHRITGLGIALFLVIHIVDTFFVVAYPSLYDHTVAIYGGVVSGTYFPPLRWAFRFAELGLIASVLFHAVNGVRIVMFDFWPGSVRLQKELAWAVLTIFVAVMIPVAVVVFWPLTKAPNHWSIPGAEAAPSLTTAGAIASGTPMLGD